MKSTQRAHTLDEIENALRNTKGMIAPAAKTLGMTRSSLYERVQRSERLKTAMQDERESMTDTAELALHRAIVGGEAWAVCFYLKTQGKSRGYVEKQEFEHSGGVLIRGYPGVDLDAV